MAVAFDASTKSSVFTAATLGTITYGGVPLVLVEEAHDTAGELLGSYAYFLGSSIPTGAQTVEIKNSGGTTLTSFTHTPVGTPKSVVILISEAVPVTEMVAWCVTQTAAASTAIEATAVVEEDAADPTPVLVTGAGVNTYVISLFTSGLPNPGAIGAATGFSAIDSHDFISQVAKTMDIDANATGGSVNVLWTTGAVVDDVAVVALAIKEVVEQFLSPSADSVDGAWTDNAAGTALAAAIDETTASDGDYIQSENSPNNSGCRVKVAAGSDPGISTGHVIRWRCRRDSALETINMTVNLYQGGGDSLGLGTLIASRTRNDVSDAFVTYSELLTPTEANAITDYTDLYLEFYADAA